MLRDMLDRLRSRPTTRTILASSVRDLPDLPVEDAFEHRISAREMRRQLIRSARLLPSEHASTQSAL